LYIYNEDVRYLLIFFVFSVVGWVIDTTYRSVAKARYAPGNRYPFSPVYGVGALVLSFFYASTPLSVYGSILTAGILMVFVEFAAGLASELVLGRRLWDYSKNPLNFMGHVDLLHACFWLLLAALYYWLGGFFPLY